MITFRVFARPLEKVFKLNEGAFIPLSHCWKVRRKTVTFARHFSHSELSIIESSHPPVRFPELPFHEMMFENIHRWQDKIAFECGVSGKKWTYKEFYNYTKNLAFSLQKKLHLKKGDYQCIVLPNCPEYPTIILAGSMIGITTTTANPLYTPHEISVHINTTQPKIIFTAPEIFESCVEALNKLKKKLPIIVVNINPKSTIPEGAIDYGEMTNSSTPGKLDPVDINTDETIVTPFSSGTSGLPKGVELSHRNIIANLTQLQQQSFHKEDRDKDSNQVLTLGLLPMFHIYGMVVVTFDTLLTGERLIILPKFEPQLLVETIHNKKTGLLYLVPPLIFFLAHQPLVKKEHLVNVSFVFSGAAACGSSDIDVLKGKVPKATIAQGYGMTETSPVITMTHRTRVRKTGSAGHPLSLTQVKIIDIETGKTVPKGTEGEICVKGPQVMKGYLNLPDTTKSSFDSEGWLKTGDIGYCDRENDLFVIDRLKELIKVKGFQVAPAEIEELLRSHPKIADAGVIGVPHDKQGEVPMAYVVLKKNETITEKEVKDFIKENLSPYKQLEGGVRFIDTIPRNSAGKILRKTLIELFKSSR